MVVNGVENAHNIKKTKGVKNMNKFKSKEEMTSRLLISEYIDDIKAFDDPNERFHTPLAKEAMANLEETFAKAPDEVKYDKELVLRILEYDINCFKNVPEKLKKDPEIQERVLKTLKNYTIQEILNLTDFKTNELGEPIVTPNMSTIEAIINQKDFKEEERYPQLVKVLTYNEKYTNNENGPRPPDNFNYNLNINPNYQEYSQEKNENQIESEKPLEEPQPENGFPDIQMTSMLENENSLDLDY